ncbi:alpha/beta fold hydrolase [Kocuria rosea]|uniref:alpha/beta fold hydrolase n=1 Tax=Kocuria rosea TaxID=1275 RepID=UPI002B24FA5C|nr:alpha/beta fold hydrolase [Kocuria rosea]MEB2528811.1 alpha/beta fold hydrolase [Kocuria rosea]MEB2619352.1 alpha/beta fold hydrolase [Kocuria rosea]
MTNFVLVHGAFHGGWCWKLVVEELESRGHQAVVLDLPGSGDDQTPLEDVSRDAAVERVVETITSLNGPVVLVAHSMGGVVITQVADRVPELIDRLVYVAAFRPQDGESLLDLAARPEGAGDQVQANLTIEGNPPVAKFDATMAKEVLYHDCPDDLARWAVEHLRPHPLSVDVTPVSLSRGAFAPTDYVVCTEDHATPIPLQRFMSTRDPARVFELASSHSPFLSRPQELVDILVSDS